MVNSDIIVVVERVMDNQCSSSQDDVINISIKVIKVRQEGSLGLTYRPQNLVVSMVHLTSLSLE